LGIGPGDIVGVMLPNWREWLVACVATQQAGAVLLPIVTIYGARELGFILRQSRAKVLITPDRWRGIDYAALPKACGDLADHAAYTLWVGRDFESLEADIAVSPPSIRGADELTVLVYTSGTTADPKGVMHSSRSLLAELEIQARSSKGCLQRGQPLTLAPGTHSWRLGNAPLSRAGNAPCSHGPVWDADIAAELIDQHKVTSSSGTPFHLTGHHGRGRSPWAQSLILAQLHCRSRASTPPRSFSVAWIKASRFIIATVQASIPRLRRASPTTRWISSCIPRAGRWRARSCALSMTRGEMSLSTRMAKSRPGDPTCSKATSIPR